MNLAALSTTQIIIIIAVAAVVVLAIVATALSIRKRRTEKLRTRFGSAEYTRAVTEGGTQQKAEAALNARAARVVTFLMSSILCSEWQLRGWVEKMVSFLNLRDAATDAPAPPIKIHHAPCASAPKAPRRIPIQPSNAYNSTPTPVEIRMPLINYSAIRNHCKYLKTNNCPLILINYV